VFPLSGLAGMPFVGKTGWGAFSSHCPEDGNIVILFAPHVGVDGEGNIGKITRDGQNFASGACGAAIGAYKALRADSEVGNFQNGYLDSQMDTIKHLLKPHTQGISESENEMAALSYKMYDILLEFLNRIVDLKWQGPNSKLAIVGGIMINCEGDKTDMFLPLMFETRS